MSSDNIDNADLFEDLSLLNIGSNNESNNNEEKEATSTDTENKNTATILLCANCGKEGRDDMNTCNKCDLVVYCNAACKKKHRSRHKKKCEKRAAELYDEELYKDSPPPEDCPICFLPLPLSDEHTSGMTFHPCCGKRICNGCIYAMRETGCKNMKLCPFCKAPPSKSDKDHVERVKKLMETGNANAFYQLAGYYRRGIKGLPHDWTKANELYLKAGELGHAEGYFNLGCSYQDGNGVEMDEKKAKHYYELAAMNGSILARNNLGCMEGQTGNHQRAYKHALIAAKTGDKRSLDNLKDGYMEGYITKEHYANTLRAYQKSQDEMKSDARDKAQAFEEMMMMLKILDDDDLREPSGSPNQRGST